MSLPQACAVNEMVARIQGLGFDPSRWMTERRSAAVESRTVDEVAHDIIALARRADLTYLRRSVDVEGLRTLLTDESLPAVVLGADGSGLVTATVIRQRAGSRLLFARIAPDGTETEVEMTASAFLEGWTGSVTLLIPVVVTPLIGGSLVGGPDGDHAEHPTPGQRLWQLILSQKRDIWLTWAYALLVGLFSLALPLGVQSIIQLVQGNMLLQPVVLLIGFVIFGSLASGLLQIMQLSVVEVIQQRVFAQMAVEFAHRVPRIRSESIFSMNLPEQMNRFFEALTIQKSLAKLLTDGVGALVSIVFGLILLTFYHPYFTFFGLGLLVAMTAIFWLTGRPGLETSLAESKYKYQLVHWFETMANSIAAFKFAGQSNLALDKTDAMLSGYLKYRKKHFRVIITQATSIVAFKAIVIGALLIMGTLLVQDGQITVGQFVASDLVIVTVLGAIEKLIGSISVVYDILTAVEKAGHVTDMPLEPSGGHLPAVGGAGTAIEVRQLRVTYPGASRPALDGITLSVRSGERVGITGFDGAGASTLALALSGVLDAYDGTIVYDGRTLRELDRSALRATIGQYLSRTDLFDGTIEENVSVGRPAATPAAVQQAIANVGLSQWVQDQPLGLRTMIANGGRGISVNVSTRLLLAQALAAAPRLLVIDDFFATVDPEMRDQLTKLVIDRSAPWTVVAVSHDPNFLVACDRIIVLRDGVVVREGTWAECAGDPVVEHLLRPAAAATA